MPHAAIIKTTKHPFSLKGRATPATMRKNTWSSNLSRDFMLSAFTFTHRTKPSHSQTRATQLLFLIAAVAMGVIPILIVAKEGVAFCAFFFGFLRRLIEGRVLYSGMIYGL